MEANNHTIIRINESDMSYFILSFLLLACLQLKHSSFQPLMETKRGRDDKCVACLTFVFPVGKRTGNTSVTIQVQSRALNADFHYSGSGAKYNKIGHFIFIIPPSQIPLRPLQFNFQYVGSFALLKP